MKHLILLFSTVLVIFGCSSNNNGTVTVVPLAPTNLTGAVISTTQINLSWTDNATNEEGYKIERKTGAGNYAVVGSTSSNMTSFSDLGLTPSTSYTYRVYAYNSAGNSLQYSNEVTISTQDSIPSWLTNGLVAYYPFNGNANDESGNGNNGTVNGATLANDRFGSVGKAYGFNSTNISIPMNQQLHNLPNRSFSCWFYANGNQNGGRIYESTYLNGGLALYNGNILGAWYSNGDKECNVTNVNTGSLNTWHHIAYISNCNTGEGLIYLDGVLVSSRIGNTTTSPQNWSNNFIRFGIGAQNEAFKGLIDDIRIYNRALSASEVAYLAAH